MNSLPRLLAAQTHSSPDAPAIVSDDETVSYGVLDRRANAVARTLIANGVRPGDLVIVEIPRSIAYVVAILGVLKAGAGYVPVDVSWPRARKDLVRDDTNAALVLTDQDVSTRETSDPPDVTNDLAYVMYTSGSTGRPKGVVVTAGNVAAFAQQPCWRNGNHQRVLAVASTAFDASTYEIWVPLLNGGTIVLAEGDVDIDLLRTQIRRHGVTALFLTAALFHLVAQEDPVCLNGIREVTAGGDVVSPAAARRVLDACPGIEVHNGYGPTENTVFATRHRVTDTTGALPIGRPLENVQTRVENGELLVGGPQVARGYLNDPANDRFRDGWYRTGDLVRENENGEFEFLGRADRQVKVRGFRVEPEEVEVVLGGLVEQCAVTVHDGRLIAYVTGEADRLEEQLRATLPEYLVPSQFVTLTALPRTTAGKIDRAALPVPALQTAGGEVRTSTEEALCALASEVLNRTIGTNDAFVKAGGDSITAIQLVSRARRQGIAITVADVLKKDIAALAKSATPAKSTDITDDFGDELPLTPVQEGLYFHSLIEPGSYHVQLVFELDGEVDTARLHWAARMVVTRNPALRAGFAPGPKQFVAGQVVVPWEESAQDLDDFLRVDKTRRFDVTTPPLLRFTLVQRRTLVLTYHHLLFDGWSVPLVLKDLLGLYGNAELPPPVPFQRHLAWLATQPDDERAWRTALAGLDAPTLVSSSPGVRPHERVFGALPPETAELARTSGVTLNTVIQVVWALLLTTMTGRGDVVFGATVSGRPAELPGVEDVVGSLINTIPVRVKLNAEETVAQLLRRVRDEQNDLLAHHHVGLARIQRVAGLGQLFDTITVLESFPYDEKALCTNELRIASWVSHDAPHYPLALAVTPDLKVRLTYRPDLFNGEQITTILRRFTRIAHALLTGTTIGEIDALDPEEHDQLARWNDTDTEVPARTLPELFAAQAARTPDRVAISFDGADITYGRLAGKVEHLARQLHAQGVRRGDRVALRMPRSTDLVIAMLAVTKAGAAFVPLDPAYPQARADYMLMDANPRLVLDKLPNFPTTATPVDGPELGDTAYVIYTSGSTGAPKGVEVTHRGIASLVAAQQRSWQLDEGSKVLHWASPSFDAAFWEVAGALLTGATLVIADQERARPGDPLRTLLRDNGITHIMTAPSALAVLSDDAIPAHTTIIVGGEPCSPEVAARWSRGRRLINAYGPTEATVCTVMSDPLTGPDAPIGRPIANTKAHVVDALGRLLPIGVAGELVLSGSSIAKGYLNRPELTAEKFGGRFGENSYRTGDLVRRRIDGTLDHLGRLDDQMKVRGLRVEPGEIESALAAHESVRACAVVASGTSLVAFVVADNGFRPAELRAHLRELLPAHLVPSAVLKLGELPMTPSGKLDRRALVRRAEQRTLDLSAFVPPRTELEDRIAALFGQVLGHDRVGTRETFFDLGGDSLQLVRLQGVLTAELGREVPIVDLYAHNTVAALAGHLGEVEQDRAEHLTAAQTRAAARQRAVHQAVRREIRGRQ